MTFCLQVLAIRRARASASASKMTKRSQAVKECFGTLSISHLSQAPCMASHKQQGMHVECFMMDSYHGETGLEGLSSRTLQTTAELSFLACLVCLFVRSQELRPGLIHEVCQPGLSPLSVVRQDEAPREELESHVERMKDSKQKQQSLALRFA